MLALGTQRKRTAREYFGYQKEAKEKEHPTQQVRLLVALTTAKLAALF